MHKWTALLALCATAIACGTESADDPSAGTGILGGNPLTVAFESDDEAMDPQGVEALLDIQIHYGLVRFGYPDEDGACVLEAEFDSYEEVVMPGERTSIQVDGDVYPCAMNVRPPQGQALVTATIDAGLQTVEVALSEETGFVIDLDPIQADDDENPEVVAVLSVEQVLTGFDLTVLLALVGDVEDGSAVGDDILAAIEAAVTVYRDPTPGDGEILATERIAANVAGQFRFE